MKAIFFTILVCFTISLSAAAQIKRRAPQHLNLEQQPLVIVNSIESNLNDFWLSPDKIKSIKVLKDSTATAVYGDKAKNGVLIIETKPDVEFLKLTTLLDQFNISEKDRTLKICKDKILIENPDKILANKSDIIKVEIITDTYWLTPLIAGSEERFINIVTHKLAY